MSPIRKRRLFILHECILCEIKRLEAELYHLSRIRKIAMQKIINGKYDLMLLKSKVEYLHPCEKHLAIIMQYRKKDRIAIEAAIEQQNNLVRIAYDELTKAHLAYTESVINNGEASLEARRVKFTVTHLKKVWAQRKRRLAEMQALAS